MALARNNGHKYPNSYDSAMGILNGKSRKVIDNNTVLRHVDNSAIVSLHNNDIVCFMKDGTREIRTRGYATRTTYSRIRACGFNVAMGEVDSKGMRV